MPYILHEVGNCRIFSAARGRYDGNYYPQVNPEAHVRPGLGNHLHHLGDLPNLSVDENSNGSLYTITSRITLSDRLTTLFDKDSSAFIIHDLQNRYVPDPPTKYALGGPRVACVVIVEE